MIDDVVTYDDQPIDISYLLQQLLDLFRSDQSDRDQYYLTISTSLDDLNTNVIELNDNIRSLSSFLVGAFSILFVLALAYALFNQLFK